MGIFRTWDLTDEQLETQRRYLAERSASDLANAFDGVNKYMLKVVETELDFRADPAHSTDFARIAAWTNYMDYVRAQPRPTVSTAVE